MKYRIVDRKYRFVSAFDTETGAYVRTGVLDDKGKDTGVDPFMASFPHLIDVGVMGHCIHASLNRSKKGATGLLFLYLAYWDICPGFCFPLAPLIQLCYNSHWLEHSNYNRDTGRFARWLRL